MKLKLNLDAIKSKTGKTKIQIAEEAGTTTRTLQKWANGENVKSFLPLTKLMQISEMDYNELFTIEEQ